MQDLTPTSPWDALDRHVGVAFDRAMPAFDRAARLDDGIWRPALWVMVACVLLAAGMRLALRVPRT
jgi:hypothetical protein